ncbi:hypothetical protein Q667_15735 [Marinobacter sp. C1S70]|uniref:hypothetical protein n=1 Tax=Marinobacter sp. C1S70 TaxID=1396859 RepID=UPI0003B864C9|nr:hypothetical protein [Marinobacter sp. C1S70]ERS87022.1 hypothetical protein Q667_15735 [Marinobacter sp. C1S70]
MKSYDPYDIWALPTLGKLKNSWTQRGKAGVIFVPLIGMAEIGAPIILRKLLGIRPKEFAHVEAMRYLYGEQSISNALHCFHDSVTSGGGWGLPFSWFSKNGIYSERLAYITNTPYVMEALLDISRSPGHQESAMVAFNQTWLFLNNLRVMASEDERLALSYSTTDEPRIVINANSYAAFAFSLHAKYGTVGNRNQAKKNAYKIINWIISQQQKDGSWYYYADKQPGNFIDCFHSCFVIKNLLKVQRELPEIAGTITPAVEKGWRYIRQNLYDSSSGLCLRFSQRSHKDPFRWDLYDQAEYLGLLIDFQLYEEARSFCENVENRFKKNSSWYCRIDIFGRRWGKDFLRWGIAPFKYHRHRLVNAVGEYW